MVSVFNCLILMSQFKVKYDLDKRKSIYNTIKNNYVNRYPVIVNSYSYNDPKISKNRYIVPNNETIGIYY